MSWHTCYVMTCISCHDMHIMSWHIKLLNFQIGRWWTYDSLTTSHQVSMVQWRRRGSIVSIQNSIYASFNGVIIGNFRNCLVIGYISKPDKVWIQTTCFFRILFTKGYLSKEWDLFQCFQKTVFEPSSELHPMDPCGSGAKKYTDDEDGDSGLTATQIGILTLISSLFGFIAIMH